MSYITITRRHAGSAYENTVCMTKEECKVLLPYFQKAHNEVNEKYEKYVDIRNGGEATERDINLMMKYTEKREHLGSVLSDIKDLLKES